MEISFTKVNYIYNGDKIYQALKDINLSLSAHDITVILGPAGAGKSTLLEHSNALLIPTSGSVNILGRIVSKKSARFLKDLRRQVGLVFQFPEYQLFANTVLDDIAFGPKNFKATRKLATKLAFDAANTLGINEQVLKSHPLKLSGGQMRLVSLAGILAMNPRFLVLDEPTRGLDSQSSILIKQQILNLHKEKKGIIVVTHDVDFALEIGTRFIILCDGQVAFDGDKKSFLEISDYSLLGLNRPINLELQDLFNSKFGLQISKHASFSGLVTQIKEQLK